MAADTRPFIPCLTFCPALRFHVPFTCTKLNTVSFCRLRFSIVEFSRDGWLGTAGWRISGVLTVKCSSALSICEASINNGMRRISRNLGGAYEQLMKGYLAAKPWRLTDFELTQLTFAKNCYMWWARVRKTTEASGLWNIRLLDVLWELNVVQVLFCKWTCHRLWSQMYLFIYFS